MSTLKWIRMEKIWTTQEELTSMEGVETMGGSHGLTKANVTREKEENKTCENDTLTNQNQSKQFSSILQFFIKNILFASK